MRLTAPAALVALLLAPCAYGQDVPRGILPAKGSYFCEIDVAWPGEARPSPAIGRVQRIGDTQILIAVGKRHVYSFPTVEEAWGYVLDQVVMAVSGARFGDDVVDAFTFKNRTRSWDTAKNASEIGPADTRFFNAVVKQLTGCDRTPARK